MFVSDGPCKIGVRGLQFPFQLAPALGETLLKRIDPALLAGVEIEFSVKQYVDTALFRGIPAQLLSEPQRTESHKERDKRDEDITMGVRHDQSASR